MSISLTERRAWIFDLDGTLTRPVHDFAYIRKELGIAADDDILETIAVQPDERKRTMIAQLDVMERHFASQAAPAEGVISCLTHLNSCGCKLGILTRNTKELAILSLKAIGLDHLFRFEHILGRDEVNPKPAPDGINFLLNQWDMPVECGVMVGDFHFDLLSGRAAGVLTVHVDEQDRHWPEATDIRVNNLAQLESLVHL